MRCDDLTYNDRAVESPFLWKVWVHRLQSIWEIRGRIRKRKKYYCSWVVVCAFWGFDVASPSGCGFCVNFLCPFACSFCLFLSFLLPQSSFPTEYGQNNSLEITLFNHLHEQNGYVVNSHLRNKLSSLSWGDVIVI